MSDMSDWSDSSHPPDKFVNTKRAGGSGIVTNPGSEAAERAQTGVKAVLTKKPGKGAL